MSRYNVKKSPLTPISSCAVKVGENVINEVESRTVESLPWKLEPVAEVSEDQPADVRRPSPMGPRRRVNTPPETRPPRLLWPYVVGITGIHLAALSGAIPWLFSWSGVVVMFISLYVFNTLGINLCYHRLLTHQGLKVPKWLERTLTTLGVLCLQDTPARWVAIHRIHHKHSDEEFDPHSPWVTLFWGHLGWLLYENRELSRLSTYERYARDILRDRYYMWMERNVMWFMMYLGLLGVYFAGGFAAGWLMEGTLLGATQFGLSIMIWGVLIRTVLAWHITWAVNSLSHRWGYRNYETGENSTNNWFVALISNGEGWHNNHHADQRSAAHGHRWWEFDVTWITILFLEKIGLAKDVVRPRRRPEKLVRVHGEADA